MLGQPPAWAHHDPCATSARGQCYGEITAHGLRRLLQLLPPQCALRADTVVHDVGSGFGDAAARLRRWTNVSRVVGIEINACRAAAAANRHGRTAGLELSAGDVRRVGFASAHVVYLTPQCWAADLLGVIFSELAPRAPSLRCIVAFGSIDALAAQGLPALVQRWGSIARVGRDVEGTWDARAAAVYVTRDGRGACANRTSAACVRRMRRLLASASTAAERAAAADGDAGPASPWRRPPERDG